MNRTERLYAIVGELRLAAPRGRTAAWLADRFEVSGRTIKRDMAALHAADVGLVADEGRGGGYALDQRRVLPPLAFTASEATAVAIAIGATPDLPFRADAQAALTRILGAMTASQRAVARATSARVWVRPGPARGRWARVLDEALQRRLVVNIDYVRSDGSRTDGRPVEPMAFARTRHHWQLLAWCRVRCGGRWFRMDRVVGAHLTREVAPVRDLAETFGPPPADASPITFAG